MTYFYRNLLPKNNEITMCLIKEINKEYIYVELLEYGNIQGMILFSEASIKKRRKTRLLVKENNSYPLLVLNIDQDKQFIDLTTKYIDESSRDICISNYDDNLKAFKILEDFNGKPDNTYWNIQDMTYLKYLTDEYLHNGNLDLFELSDDEKNEFKEVIKNFFGNLTITSKLNFSVRNPNYSGISKIKEIFDIISENFQLDIKQDTTPKFYVSVKNHTDINANNTILNQINEEMQELFEENNCIYTKMDITYAVKYDNSSSV